MAADAPASSLDPRAKRSSIARGDVDGSETNEVSDSGLATPRAQDDTGGGRIRQHHLCRRSREGREAHKYKRQNGERKKEKEKERIKQHIEAVGDVTKAAQPVPSPKRQG
ncbi:hypothetical protein CIRG_05520 [Coccidioides immitis RMSCC 2394]|uniref:Predicted protein n=3 Tax=Coccidioides TaxID=5500 RepID=E9DGW8_COCPS|nr:predicted protein [Coccidioides posadasii str. Silveira]KMM69729.1 hypothetical protein CPAG_06043 [Coccidioides posadasii RMSCC 3488]KMP05839.1 hypothetical protein CIRG_05520 [Coccidioides immitis RMSCC 2394]